jgi:hypothetical protein
MPRNRALSAALLTLGLVLVAGAIFYATQKTNFLASGRPAHHWTHAIAFAIVAVVALAAAALTWPRAARV